MNDNTTDNDNNNDNNLYNLNKNEYTIMPTNTFHSNIFRTEVKRKTKRPGKAICFPADLLFRDYSSGIIWYVLRTQSE